MPFWGKLPGCGTITLNRSELMFYWRFFVLFFLPSRPITLRVFL